jgi:hypothetical protein
MAFAISLISFSGTSCPNRFHYAIPEIRQPVTSIFRTGIWRGKARDQCGRFQVHIFFSGVVALTNKALQPKIKNLYWKKTRKRLLEFKQEQLLQLNYTYHRTRETTRTGICSWSFFFPATGITL